MRAKLVYKGDRWVTPVALLLTLATPLAWLLSGTLAAVSCWAGAATLLTWRKHREARSWRELSETNLETGVAAALTQANPELTRIPWRGKRTAPAQGVPQVGASQMLQGAIDEVNE